MQMASTNDYLSSAILFEHNDLQEVVETPEDGIYVQPDQVLT